MTCRGLSTIELLIALAVMATAIAASSFVAINVPNIVADARRATIALAQARDALATASSTVDEELEDEQFIWRTAEAGWTTSRGEARSIRFSTIIRSSIEPSACDPFTSGDWSRPKLIQRYTLRSAALLTGTVTISSLAIAPNLLVIGAASSSQASIPTLFFFRLQGSSTPLFIGSFDNATTSRIGIGAVAVHGETIFSGNAFSSASPGTCADGMSCAQLYSFATAKLISLLTLATSSEPYAYQVDGSSAPVSALTYYQGFLYTGLRKTVQGDEFNVIDARDPTNLRWVSGYRIGRTVNGITVRGNYAYVSTDDSSRELMVFDVSEPIPLKLVSVWDAPGAPTFGYGSVSTAYKNSIRFGRTYTGNAPEFELLQLASSSISGIATIDSGTSKDPESVKAMETQDRFTFVLLTHRLDVLDTHVPTDAQLVGSYILPAGSRGAALACRNNQLYLAWNGTDGSGSIDVLQGS